MEGFDPVTGLPPAGNAREETLKKRLDALDEEGERKAEQLDHHKLDSGVLVPDRELQHEIQDHDALDVSHKQPGYVYCWVYTGIHGQMVWSKKYQKWEVVQGNDPEAKEYKHVDTTRRVGDTILMRIRMDLHAELQEREAEKRRKQQEGVTSELKEMGARHRDKFIVHADPETNPHMGSMKASAARQTAMKGVDQMLRRGNVPGMPVGKR